MEFEIFKRCILNDIDPDQMFGLDAQHIIFEPYTERPADKHDRIWNEAKRIDMVCVTPGTFRLVTNDARDFVTGYDLCLDYKITPRIK